MATQIGDLTLEIGEMAGTVWHYLDDRGPTSIKKLLKDVGAPRDLLMQALGWLAREDKLVFEKVRRTETVRLR